jgi:hypothetical protein
MQKLGLWLKHATPQEREYLAREVGTSVGYLRLLGYGHRENPKVRLALGIVKTAARMHHQTHGRLPLISIYDLARHPVHDVEEIK